MLKRADGECLLTQEIYDAARQNKWGDDETHYFYGDTDLYICKPSNDWGPRYFRSYKNVDLGPVILRSIEDVSCAYGYERNPLPSEPHADNPAIPHLDISETDQELFEALVQWAYAAISSPTPRMHSRSYSAIVKEFAKEQIAQKDYNERDEKAAALLASFPKIMQPKEGN